MSDKEILVQSIDSYAKKLASDLFHLNSVASQSLITYVIRNLEDKSGNINIDLLGNAVIEEIKNRSKKGLVVDIFGKPVVFNEADVNELVKIFKDFKSND